MILIRGGGDLATGVALRAYRAGYRVVVTELAQPLAVRRTVSFSEAIYSGEVIIEGVKGRSAIADEITQAHKDHIIPVLVDPEAEVLASLQSARKRIVVDARMTKQPPSPLSMQPDLLIGLGPGYHAGSNCDAVIETRRGHTLGRVYWKGTVEMDTKTPEGDPRRVLRAPVNGVVVSHKSIADHCEPGDLIAEIISNSAPDTRVQLVAPIKGVLRGLIHPGIPVVKDTKIGDIDPRDDPSYCFLVSDKSLAVGGGVLEAILTRVGTRE
jgi:xanthine dehydrogenase accessory factor